MNFADLDLSRRLERAEGRSCLEFAEARGRLHSQSFGLGLFEPLSPASLDTIEAFFQDRGAGVVHEVSPLAAIAPLDLLCTRGYRPELSSVLHQPLERPAKALPDGVTVRVAGPVSVLMQPGKLGLSVRRRGE